LANFGIPDPLPDPVLELHGPPGFITILNDNWRDTQQEAIKATGLAPTNNLESAILVTLSPGSYTVVLKGNGNLTGTGLNEVYDLSPSAGGILTAVGTRANILSGADILISGIVIPPSGGGDVLVRVLGPSLANVGVPNVLADPSLELRDSNGALLRANNNWRDTQEAEIIATGIPPTNDLESAIVSSLAPGSYTALASGNNNGTGIGYVQLYTLPHSAPELELICPFCGQ
jgi:hypothetical protein